MSQAYGLGFLTFLTSEPSVLKYYFPTSNHYNYYLLNN